MVSAAVRDHLIDGVDVSFEDLGDRQLKGFDRPVRAFRAWPPGPLPNVAMDRRRRSGDRPAIAVLPFRNLSGNPRHDFVGDLIAEDVISDMSRLTDLYVISRLSTAPFRDRLYQTRNIAEMLGARYVLTGSVLSDDTRLRLTAELTEADATHVLWSDRFEGALADVFGLRDRLSSEIATRAVPFLRQLELQRARSRRPEDLTAYELTLRAIDLMHGRSHEDLDRAQALFTQAMSIDPHYATPRVWLARSHVLRVGQGWSDDPRKDTSDALRHAEEALALDGNDAYAIAVWGFVSAYLEKDLDVALARYDLALQVNPSAVWAWAWSASANAWQGNGEKAVTLIQRAIDLSPFDPHMYNFASIACAAHAIAGDYDTAIQWGRRSLRENRLYTAAFKNLTIALALSGRTQEARRCRSRTPAARTRADGGWIPEPAPRQRRPAHRSLLRRAGNRRGTALASNLGLQRPGVADVAAASSVRHAGGRLHMTSTLRWWVRKRSRPNPRNRPKPAEAAEVGRIGGVCVRRLLRRRASVPLLDQCAVDHPRRDHAWS